MNYEIIKDEKLLDEFIDWLPNLQSTEKFYVALFARKKYDKALQSTASDKMQLKRFLATKENLKLKISQLEIPLGRYSLKTMAATQQSLAVYITPNPRCMIKANKLMLTKCAEAIVKGNYFHNLHQEAISCVQQSKSYAYVVDFDIDSKDVDLKKVREILPDGTYRILETRGGYHILAYPDRIKTWNEGSNTGLVIPNNWFQKIQKTFDVDQSGDQMIPVVGCCQGEFIPKFIEI